MVDCSWLIPLRGLVDQSLGKCWWLLCLGHFLPPFELTITVGPKWPALAAITIRFGSRGS